MRIREAVGQLLFYEYFDVVPMQPGRDIVKLVAVDKVIDVSLADFLQQCGIGLVVVTELGWEPINALASELEPLLGPPITGG